MQVRERNKAPSHWLGWCSTRGNGFVPTGAGCCKNSMTIFPPPSLQFTFPPADASPVLSNLQNCDLSESIFFMKFQALGILSSQHKMDHDTYSTHTSSKVPCGTISKRRYEGWGDGLVGKVLNMKT